MQAIEEVLDVVFAPAGSLEFSWGLAGKIPA